MRSFALGLTQEAMVIDRGTVAFYGSSQALLADRAVLDRFVGLHRL
jgi:ABC-type branched-subunit amino acid transport system ATPase component